MVRYGSKPNQIFFEWELNQQSFMATHTQTIEEKKNRISWNRTKFHVQCFLLYKIDFNIKFVFSSSGFFCCCCCWMKWVEKQITNWERKKKTKIINVTFLLCSGNFVCIMFWLWQSWNEKLKHKMTKQYFARYFRLFGMCICQTESV